MIKIASKFVKDLENFHFGEKSFHRNESFDKVANHCASVGVHFAYSHHFHKDEVTYMNAYNMIALSKCFKKKNNTIGGKCSSNTTKQHKQQEEATKK